MKLSRNYLIAALVLVVLYMMFMRPQKAGFCFGGCSGWLPAGVRNPNPGYYKYSKTSRNGLQVNYCHCN